MAFWLGLPMMMMIALIKTQLRISTKIFFIGKIGVILEEPWPKEPGPKEPWQRNLDPKEPWQKEPLSHGVHTICNVLRFVSSMYGKNQHVIGNHIIEVNFRGRISARHLTRQFFLFDVKSQKFFIYLGVLQLSLPYQWKSIYFLIIKICLKSNFIISFYKF